MCPQCQDTYWKPVVVDGVERVVRCDCWRTDLVGRRLKESGIPPQFGRAELDNFERNFDTQLQAWQKAVKFVEAFPVVDKGLLLYGMTGVGKTHLAVGILKAVIREKGARGYFFETSAFLKQVRNTYNNSVDSTEMAILEPALASELLVLDDLGFERMSEWVQETIGLVINARYNKQLPTIITSNLVEVEDNTIEKSFIFQLGMRTRSRLLEMCDWVEMRGPDIRDIGPQASVAEVARWYKQSPASPERLPKPGDSKHRGQARARLRDRGPVDLKWTGGKGGS
jgi:DNA replication protein DnaC